MPSSISQSDLEAYLDESLPAEQMTQIELALRQDEALRQQLAETCGRRDAGVHSLGAIWRRHRLSCPTREQLGSYLLSALDADTENYIRFHLHEIGCRYCQANLADLESRRRPCDASDEQRRRRYFQSSAGLLRR